MMHHAAIDITGQVFGFLTAITPTSKRSGTNILWHCICNCGKNTCAKHILVRCSRLTSGQSQSCGV